MSKPFLESYTLRIPSTLLASLRSVNQSLQQRTLPSETSMVVSWYTPSIFHLKAERLYGYQQRGRYPGSGSGPRPWSRPWSGTWSRAWPRNWKDAAEGSTGNLQRWYQCAQRTSYRWWFSERGERRGDRGRQSEPEPRAPAS